LICAPGDPDALAADMRTLLNASVRARVGQNAREAMLPLTPAAMTQQLLALYRALLGARSPT
jgi:hypothetical protein